LGDATSSAVYYSPHADDEALSMGGSMLASIENGDEVAVVLLSKGKASAARNHVNNRLEKEEKPALSVEEFGEARVKEFKKSAEALGIDPKNIFIYDLPDGNILKEDVSKIMEKMNKQFPNASHHAMSYKDPHRDHAASGQALKDLVEKGAISSGYFYLAVPDGLAEKYRESLSSYNIWDPDNGFYAIGYTSVDTYFHSAEKILESKWHH
jgi:LmbE family N-acetylglucosaminyl deacetylase